MNTRRPDVRDAAASEPDTSTFAALNRADQTHEPVARPARPWAWIVGLAVLAAAVVGLLLWAAGN